MTCPCISNVDNLLRPQNACLTTTLFGNPERVVIATDKIDTRKRGKPPAMLASFCPFCGVKYERRAEAADTSERQPQIPGSAQ